MLLIKSKVRWAKFRKQDKYGHYGAELVDLSDDAKAKLKAAGIKVKFDADSEAGSPNFKGWYIKLRAAEPVRVVDSKLNVLPDSLIIGNDSVVEVAIQAKKWTMKSTGASGVRAIPLVVKLLELKKYDPDAAAREQAMAALEESEGFVFEDSEEATPAATEDSPDPDEIFKA